MRRNVITLVLCTIFCVGCGYGEVSPKTYDIATSLYNISNRKLADRVDAVREQIDLARENDEISSSEAKWLEAIAQHAEDQNWKRAMKASRRMMDDQVAR